MTYCIDTRSIHPHMAPFVASLKANLCSNDSVAYVYRGTPNDPNRAVGAKGLVDDIAIFWDGESDDYGRKCVMTSDVLIENHRDFELIEERIRQDRFTVYQSERWFKPLRIGVTIPGFLRMALPFGIKRAIRIVQLFGRGKNFYYFPLGEHAARDMARLCGIMHGDLRCLFRAPEIEFERKPCGRVWLRGGGVGKRYCLDKMRMWGYFVSPSKYDTHSVSEPLRTHSREIKVLWVGRLLDLKRVDTIVRAVGENANLKRVDDSLPTITLDIYGEGPELVRLQRMASRYGNVIRFHSSIPYSEVRKVMREHDLYVFASNAFEGWGAVVNEALEEGMRVIASWDAGATTVLLPRDCCFKSGDVRSLVKLLGKAIPKTGIGDWSADIAAKNFIKFIEEEKC